MTRHLRLAVAFALAAVLLAAGALRLGLTAAHWVSTAVLAYGALLASLGACREHRSHRGTVTDCERARGRARGEASIAPLDPCCAFWLASSGAVHGRRCHTLAARPPAEQQPPASITPTVNDSTE
jgi:hypothetical protein